MRTATVTLIAGTPEYHGWCPYCETPSRLRIPLHLDDTTRPPITFVDVCPECGQGYMPSKPVVTTERAPRNRGWQHPWRRFLWWLARRSATRHDRPVLVCAYDDCRKPGWWDCAWIEPVDGGTVRHVFCGGSHRAQWLGQHFGITDVR